VYGGGSFCGGFVGLCWWWAVWPCTLLSGRDRQRGPSEGSFIRKPQGAGAPGATVAGAERGSEEEQPLFESVMIGRVKSWWGLVIVVVVVFSLAGKGTSLVHGEEADDICLAAAADEAVRGASVLLNGRKSDDMHKFVSVQETVLPAVSYDFSET